MKLVRLGFGRQVLVRNNGIKKKLISDMMDLLPADASIVGFGCDLSQNIDYMFVQSDDFAEMPEGSLVPDATVFFTRHNDGSISVDKIDYSTYALPKGSGCLHQWETYNGFHATETFCKSCGVKK